MARCVLTIVAFALLLHVAVSGSVPTVKCLTGDDNCRDVTNAMMVMGQTRCCKQGYVQVVNSDCSCSLTATANSAFQEIDYERKSKAMDEKMKKAFEESEIKFEEWERKFEEGKKKLEKDLRNLDELIEREFPDDRFF